MDAVGKKRSSIFRNRKKRRLEDDRLQQERRELKRQRRELDQSFIFLNELKT
jgi:hypothetical protein